MIKIAELADMARQAVTLLRELPRIRQLLEQLLENQAPR